MIRVYRIASQQTDNLENSRIFTKSPASILRKKFWLEILREYEA